MTSWLCNELCVGKGEEAYCLLILLDCLECLHPAGPRNGALPARWDYRLPHTSAYCRTNFDCKYEIYCELWVYFQHTKLEFSMCVLHYLACYTHTQWRNHQICNLPLKPSDIISTQSKANLQWRGSRRKGGSGQWLYERLISSHSSPVSCILVSHQRVSPDYSKVTKIAGRHKMVSYHFMDTTLCLPAILVIVCFPGYDSQQPSTPENPREHFSTSGNALEVSSLGCEPAGWTILSSSTSQDVLPVNQLGGLYCHTALLKVCYHVLPLLHYKWGLATGFCVFHPLWSLHTRAN